jgi:hypothetical protein
MMRDSYRELGLMVKSSIQGISNSEVNADLKQIVLQNNEPSGLTINAWKTGTWFPKTYPVSRRVALPKIAWKELNESVPLTRPPATLQSDFILVIFTRIELKEPRTIGIKLATTGGVCPHDRDQAHGQRNCTNAIIF